MMVETENRRSRNMRLRREDKIRRQQAMDMLYQLLGMPSVDDIAGMYRHCPSRFHLEPTEKNPI